MNRCFFAFFGIRNRQVQKSSSNTSLVWKTTIKSYKTYPARHEITKKPNNVVYRNAGEKDRSQSSPIRPQHHFLTAYSRLRVIAYYEALLKAWRNILEVRRGRMWRCLSVHSSVLSPPPLKRKKKHLLHIFKEHPNWQMNRSQSQSVTDMQQGNKHNCGPAQT